MHKEELAKYIAEGIIVTGVEGTYNDVSCSSAGDYPSLGISQWEGERARIPCFYNWMMEVIIETDLIVI